MTTVKVFAPAKINLTLHITGQRDDGYHLIDSLVVFSPVADIVTLTPGHPLSLTVDGPEADGVPADMNNLAMQAARILDPDWDCSIHLEKHIPAASGVGGGSADAAAVLRGSMCVLEEWVDAHLDAPDEKLLAYKDPILALGADVPMCLSSQTCRARRIGDKIDFLRLPELHALLVNPRVPVSTAEVFQALPDRRNPSMPDPLPEFGSATELVDWLATQRNDLEAPAISIAPEIAEVLGVLSRSAGCQLARMSGSGATCFGLFPDKDTAIAAGEIIRTAHPEWWVVGGPLGDQFDRAMPILS